MITLSRRHEFDFVTVLCNTKYYFNNYLTINPLKTV